VPLPVQRHAISQSLGLHGWEIALRPAQVSDKRRNWTIFGWSTINGVFGVVIFFPPEQNGAMRGLSAQLLRLLRCKSCGACRGLGKLVAVLGLLLLRFNRPRRVDIGFYTGVTSGGETLQGTATGWIGFSQNSGE
jgi:hypothetical protein